MSTDFVHLHVHSDYSVLDGACTTKQILKRCNELGMDACALTDHGNIFGAVEFYMAAKAQGIKPIIGCEVYVAPGSAEERNAKRPGEAYNHMVLLCKDETGYHNLCKLSSYGYLKGFHYKPRVDDAMLAQHSEGLIATSACLGGRIPQAVMRGDLDAANREIERYIGIFGRENFCIEIMDHGIEEEEQVNPILAELADKHGILLIATNDCHYLLKEDAEAHDALLCMNTGKMLADENRFRFEGNQFYFRDQEEMAARMTRWPQAVSNTRLVADRCNVVIPLGEHLIPNYVVPEGEEKVEYLHKLVMDGLKKRYDPLPQSHIDRAEYELDVISRMHFVDYFLVVWDLIKFAMDAEIPVGPGRGSGAGSIVAYALNITNIDPMHYSLLFERFLNPDRISMPDFDIDFCPTRREEMIEYSRNKYGADNVSQIITFGRMLAKNVIRNVGRVMGMPYGDVDRIAKLVPDELKITLEKAAAKEPELKALIENDPQVGKLWEIAKKLEGTIASCGTHAAGVVICDHPLTNHVALFKAANSDTVSTQVEMKCVEEVGLLKMDFLGLRNLTVIHQSAKLIKENRGIEIDVNHLDTHDGTTYKLLRSGQTAGVFQLESAGMRDLAKSIGLESLEELSALVALYRPGPMDNIPTYIDCKFHPENIHYPHPLLEPILKETYGVAVYQEQVMQIVQTLAGYSLGGADILRRAMGKKKPEEMAKQRKVFTEGCKEHNDIDAKLASSLFDTIEAFAGYGFNKSHTVAYAYVAYQTAYLKANFPEEFMCALLTSEEDNLGKVAIYVDETRRMGIDVLPPDINVSQSDFCVQEGDIRFGMGAIKGVGRGPTEAIVAEREANGPYTDIFDLCTRLDSKAVNKKVLESLNKAGAFASTGWNRCQVESVIEGAVQEGQIAQRDRLSGQTSLFDMSGMEEANEAMHEKPNLLEWPDAELLQQEKDVLGLYVTSHPLDQYLETLERFTTAKAATLNELAEGAEVVVGGLLSIVKPHLTKKGDKMAFMTLDTLDGPIEVTAFSDIYAAKSGLLLPDMIVMIPARVNYRNNEAGLLASDVFPIEDAEKMLTRAIHIRVPYEKIQNGMSKELAETLGQDAFRGDCDVYLHCQTPEDQEITIHATQACRVTPNRQLQRAIEGLLGADVYFCSSGMNLPTHRPPEEPKPVDPPWKRRKSG